MKTAVMFFKKDEMPEFYVLDGDYTRFNNIWLNLATMDDFRTKEELFEECAEFFYGGGIYPVDLSQFEDEIREGAKLIMCGHMS